MRLGRLLYQAAFRAWLGRLDPESAHEIALRLATAAGNYFPSLPETDRRLAVHKHGLRFPNPVGLAAGVDKNGRAVRGWARLGFGAIEIGTVTPRPQPGNPRPRVFRLPEERALINRLGFPSDGAIAVRRRLRATPPVTAPLGLNIGKNAETPLDRAADDYVEALTLLAGLGDYAVINVSSPNTPGLRDLHAAAALRDLIRQVRPVADRAGRNGAPLPLLLKVSPDLSDEQLADVTATIREERLEGVIATNTTVSRPNPRHHHAAEAGGMSGKPLREASTRIVREIRAALGPAPLVIGAGGVFGPASAFEKLQVGADLVQLYTALVYEGPGLAARINRDLAKLLAAEGFPSIRHLADPSM